ncbi:MULTISPECIES: type II toxin-antitoxin system HipA family toxin [Vibrio]|uniref:type II toxin-antitoxin system HipA family toxin n=1 Tax=Vibrio TaxID=662 RepID=UPI0006CCE7D6|nr:MULTISPECIES: HipA domain-containing protein [Vibrio]AXN34612.1 type II toxin-antitoxin system HipA family toxin [Vibrio coralliilyticus]KPH25190.1 phosphatidylinositol kinase [Vibrio coralliilyticus]MCM5511033.1 type II toxin-antitoxin system HipA family toxin [Vibrio sp. SCSIO 43169]QFT39645.1 putative DNA-binding transcriptional regulator [Vibrio sp. THAF64]QGM37848.1 putative DNA-binding transcriptional regulator [Vibrio sp. THAF191d]
MTSEQCFVWKWLNGETEPVVAGALIFSESGEMSFRYGQSYLKRDNKEPIYVEELPLIESEIYARDLDLINFSSIRDAAPDAWGRRVINSKLNLDADEPLTEFTYLMNSASDRIGSIDFQASPIQYHERGEEEATLEVLQSAADIISSGKKLPAELDKAMLHGTSLGGARPKAMISADNIKYIAKFSASNDTYDIVKSEYVAMKLAALCGINVAKVELVHSAGKDALLVERFDRSPAGDGKWYRHSMISGLTVLGLDESNARYCAYPALVDKMQVQCKNFGDDALELYKRVVFNVLVGNTDDHARNHAFFVNGEKLELTPAYDVCPQSRTGGEASHGMIIVGNSNISSIENCKQAARVFHVDEETSLDIIGHQIKVINDNFESLCDAADLSELGRKMLWKRAILNDSIFYGSEEFLEIVSYELPE